MKLEKGWDKKAKISKRRIQEFKESRVQAEKARSRELKNVAQDFMTEEIFRSS